MQTNFLNNELETFVNQTLERWHVPGMALAVVSGEEVLHLAGYGQRDPARGLPVTPDTLFPIASMTKSFAVMSFGLLVDEGKLEWDKPVRDYLPGWQMFDPVTTETLTVRDLLSHRSGLPSHDWIWWGSTSAGATCSPACAPWNRTPPCAPASSTTTCSTCWPRLSSRRSPG